MLLSTRTTRSRQRDRITSASAASGRTRPSRRYPAASPAKTPPRTVSTSEATSTPPANTDRTPSRPPRDLHRKPLAATRGRAIALTPASNPNHLTSPTAHGVNVYCRRCARSKVCCPATCADAQADHCSAPNAPRTRTSGHHPSPGPLPADRPDTAGLRPRPRSSKPTPGSGCTSSATQLRARHRRHRDHGQDPPPLDPHAACHTRLGLAAITQATALLDPHRRSRTRHRDDQQHPELPERAEALFFRCILRPGL